MLPDLSCLSIAQSVIISSAAGEDFRPAERALRGGERGFSDILSMSALIESAVVRNSDSRLPLLRSFT